MNGQDLRGGVALGGADSLMPKLTTYPLAVVDVIEGELNASDSTHFLRIQLPAQGEEIRIPYNQRGLRELARKTAQAGGIPQPERDESEG